jgi:hypothetical protein
VSLIYPVLIAVALAIGAVAGYVKHRFFEPASVHCHAGSTEKRCVRARKIAARIAAMKAEERRDHHH